MIHLQIADSSSVTIAENAITGPFAGYADSFIHGSMEYSSGCYYLNGSQLVRTAEFIPQEYAIMTPASFVIFLLACLYARTLA
jgi:hypothetical protein